MRIQPNEDYQYLGTDIVLSRHKTYRAVPANNLPNWKEHGTVFVGATGLPLNRNEYRIVSGLRWSICYEVVTPESAEHGDREEGGWLDQFGFEYPDNEQNVQDAIDGAFERTGTVADLVADCERYGICCGDGADWLYSVDPDIDWSTGEERSHSCHIRGVTDSTNDRIRQLVCS